VNTRKSILKEERTFTDVINTAFQLAAQDLQVA